MIIKVPVYIELDSKGVDSNLIPEISMVISDRLMEHLKAKLPKTSKQILRTYQDNGEKAEAITYEPITREQAIDSFR